MNTEGTEIEIIGSQDTVTNDVGEFDHLVKLKEWVEEYCADDREMAEITTKLTELARLMLDSNSLANEFHPDDLSGIAEQFGLSSAHHTGMVKSWLFQQTTSQKTWNQIDCRTVGSLAKNMEESISRLAQDSTEYKFVRTAIDYAAKSGKFPLTANCGINVLAKNFLTMNEATRNHVFVLLHCSAGSAGFLLLHISDLIGGKSPLLSSRELRILGYKDRTVPAEILTDDLEVDQRRLNPTIRQNREKRIRRDGQKRKPGRCASSSCSSCSSIDRLDHVVQQLWSLAHRRGSFKWQCSVICLQMCFQI